jgi:DNA-binding transcriptional MerR regulator
MSTQASANTYSIKEVSSLTGLPASTLRYYESIGIVKPIIRGDSSRHRVYDEEDLAIIDSIACLNATGMSIKDMKTYIANRGQGAAVADEQRQLLERQKGHLAAEAKMIAIRQQYVDLKISYWKAIKSGDDQQAEAIRLKSSKLTDILKHPAAA